MITTLFLLSLFFLYYIYDGYKRILIISAKIFKPYLNIQSSKNDELKSITILLTVYNEFDIIAVRLDNLLNLNYPPELLEILVASDGSTDGTDNYVISKTSDPRIKFFKPEKRLGKTETQNLAVKHASGEIIVFTDAGTLFDTNFLIYINQDFYDPIVGGVDGHLYFIKDEKNNLSKSQGYYWDYELSIRQLESNLGILAVASGACLAIRKNLFVPMDGTVGEDCIIPLDIISQKYKMKHNPLAIAYDKMDKSYDEELSSRTRMTVRNWQGTWKRLNLLNPFKNFSYFLSIFSHKILRWLSPLFLIILTMTSFSGIFYKEWYFIFSSFSLTIFYIIALFGFFDIKYQKQINFRLSHVAYSFIIANIGFLLGLIKVTQGYKIYKYR